MNQKITLYHGSEQLVETPTFGFGKKHNDFGLGFYCTESEELAKEWAVSSLRNGFANRYSLDTEYLKILNLNSPDYTILNWIAVLVEHRLFSIKTPAAQRAKRYLIDNFSVNVNAYDLIIGPNMRSRCCITRDFPSQKRKNIMFSARPGTMKPINIIGAYLKKKPMVCICWIF